MNYDLLLTNGEYVLAEGFHSKEVLHNEGMLAMNTLNIVDDIPFIGSMRNLPNIKNVISKHENKEHLIYSYLYPIFLDYKYMTLEEYK